MGQTLRQKFKLKNDGQLPAEIRISLEQDDVEFDDNSENAKSSEKFKLSENSENAIPEIRNNENLAFSIVEDVSVPFSTRCSYFSNDNKHSYIAVVTIPPKKLSAFEIEFSPKFAKEGNYAGELCFNVLHNPYESERVVLKGQGYNADVFLHTEYSQTIEFGELDMGQKKKIGVTLSNRSKNQAYRVEFPSLSYLSFEPKCLHIKPGSKVDVQVSLTADEKRILSNEIVSAKMNPIEYENSSVVKDWDDRMKVIKWVDVTHNNDEEAANSNSAVVLDSLKTRPVKERRVDVEPEPEHEILGEDKLELTICGVCDYGQLPVDLGFEEEMPFTKTLMYQTEEKTFIWTNTGQVALQYNWEVAYANRPVSAIPTGSRPPSRQRSYLKTAFPTTMIAPTSEIDTFSVCPPMGTIKPNETQKFVLSFQPVDVKHYTADVYCSVKNLQTQSAPIQFKTSGTGILPKCHVDLPKNDWISLRRPIDMNPPPGVQNASSLGEGEVHVLEMTTVGLHNVASYSFWLLNPTDQNYHINWNCESSKLLENGARISAVHDSPIDSSQRSSTADNGENSGDSKNNSKVYENTKKQTGIGYTVVNSRSVLESGKKLKILVELEAKHIEPISETMWNLSLQGENSRTVENLKFLFVGHVRQPNVFLDRAYLSLGRLLLNHKTSQIVNLVNKENVDYDFYIIPESCYSEGKQSSLSITPAMGTVHRNSQLPLIIAYEAKSAGESAFNILVNSPSFSKPLSLKAKIESHKMECKLVFEPQVDSSVVVGDVNFSSQTLKSSSTKFKVGPDDLVPTQEPFTLEEYR